MPITLETKVTTRPKKDLGVASPKATERTVIAISQRQFMIVRMSLMPFLPKIVLSV